MWLPSPPSVLHYHKKMEGKSTRGSLLATCHGDLNNPLSPGQAPDHGSQDRTYPWRPAIRPAARIPSPAPREGRRPGGGQDSPHPQVSGPRPKYPAGHPVRATLPRGSEASPGTRGIARPRCIQHPTPGGQGQGPGGPGPAEERAGRAARRRRQSHGGSCAFGLPGPEGFGHMLGGSGHRLQAAAGVRGNPELRER